MRVIGFFFSTPGAPGERLSHFQFATYCANVDTCTTLLNLEVTLLTLREVAHFRSLDLDSWTALLLVLGGLGGKARATLSGNDLPPGGLQGSPADTKP